MFSYHLSDGSQSYYDSEGQIKFDPPVYEQRYRTVIRILEDDKWNTQFKKIVDFGCAELRLILLLKRVLGVEHILGVDVDEETLLLKRHHLDPLLCDYIQKRERPLRIEILKGSIDAAVDNLRNVDAVIGLEIIEHLYPDVLDNVPYNIFGFMQPKLAIFSTPNADFNIIFGPSKLANGFRHFDHKFEWTREEFHQWTAAICKKYPNYSVALLGVGKPPPNHENVGFVSQIAVFARNDILGKTLAHLIDGNPLSDKNITVHYKEVHAVDYPFQIDERTEEQKVWDNVLYHIHRFRGQNIYFDLERNMCRVPLSAIIMHMEDQGVTMAELIRILQQHDFQIDGEFIDIPLSEDENDDSSSFEEDHDDDYNERTNAAPIDESNENWD